MNIISNEDSVMQRALFRKTHGETVSGSSAHWETLLEMN